MVATIFPSNSLDTLLRPYKHQVGGHVGILSLDGSHICKPHNDWESQFYRRMPSALRHWTPDLCFEAELRPSDVGADLHAYPLDSAHDHSPEPSLDSEVSEFRDVFSGVSNDVNPWALQCQIRSLKNQFHQQRFLVFENLTSRFRTPCVLDLKLGTRQHVDSASEDKKDRQKKKCAKTTSKKLGIRLCGLFLIFSLISVSILGLQYFDETMGGTYQCVDKYFGRSLDSKGLRQLLSQFFRSSDGNIRKAECLQLIDQISAIRDVVASIRGLRLFGVSLLIIFEGSPDCGEPKAIARLIDFAHASLDSEDESADEGCLLGLQTTTSTLNDLIHS